VFRVRPAFGGRKGRSMTAQRCGLCRCDVDANVLRYACRAGELAWAIDAELAVHIPPELALCQACAGLFGPRRMAELAHRLGYHGRAAGNAAGALRTLRDLVDPLPTDELAGAQR
jgi:hypothetical protein